MPAPVPITIRYDSAGLLGPLAEAAGTSAFRYNDWARRRAMDAAFTEGVLDRRSRMEMARLQADTELQKAAMTLQNASGYRDRALDLREAELAQKADYQNRELAQKAATLTSKKGKATTPVQMVSENDAVNQSGASMRVYNRDNPAEATSYTSQDGIIRGPQGEETGRFVGGAREQLIPASVKQQLDYLNSIKDQMDPAKWNSMYVAAKSGQLKMDQLIDDSRSIMAPGRLDAAGRNVDRYHAEDMELSAVSSLSPADQAQYARRKFNMQDPDLYSDEDALRALQSRQRQVGAFLKPVTNSSGRTPTGGNPVKVNTPQEAMSLPSGTYFITPDGRMKRVP